ncbi:acylphosphatase isozyme Ch1 [Dichomitus squalens]|uniref:Acylphosphatase n=2 Tax=Dichomitus squalens TaxID=114155 RepID=A0A4Q9NGV6_9APHY|nr:acylphosphatase isozyme Ch1 [Dichomitus squalens LYAD-421 SS1]EJF57150.1 acylphosphatase isozyme Ch1 [Dichomitus squalens LYAD-421 SS1]TBU22313.1 acylphosphatase isozyme Ch1 [Dichomitus squalens]TBU40379.1 acylphosphatase isozyme Ch1 [Dichomitus squalens]
MSYRTVDFRVKGKVQGVFFRVFAKNAAQELGVVGWVKNDPGGDVLGTAQGLEESLNKFKEALKKGPEHANVTGVEFTNEAPLERLQFQGFEKIRNQRPT